MTISLSAEANERVAAVIFEQVEPGLDWSHPPSEDLRELYREVARAAIQAMVGEGAPVQAVCGSWDCVAPECRPR